MKKNIIRTLAALLMAGAAFAACTKEEMPAVESQTFTMTVNASKGDAEASKQLSLEGTTLSATWAEGEAVTVYNVTRSAALSGTLTAQSSGASTTLKGTLTGTIANSDVLRLEFCSPSYSSQDGTLDYIAANCDYATATVTVTDASTSSVTTTEASFTNQQALVKFTLKDKATDAALNATRLVVGDGTHSYTVTPASDTDMLYVALPDFNNKNVTLTATVGSDIYFYEKSGVTFANGQYYDITVKMTKAIPLTMEALSDGTIEVSKPKDGMQYSKNGGAKTAVTTEAISVTTGDKVAFYGNGTSITVYGYTNSTLSTKIGGTARVKAYGNIMSLVDETGFPSDTTLSSTNVFAYLFHNNSNLTDASGLLLPVTTLYNSCYKGMFYGCTSLTAIPELPATTLAGYCYYQMFYGCTALTAAPALPATKLASYCYYEMFRGCTALTAAPALPATKLALSCYRSMFYGCTALTEAPELRTTSLSTECYRSMFNGCTALTTAPTLPATTLATSCYQEMFSGCTSLDSVTCLATSISATKCTTNWLSSVAATGTFTTPSGTSWTTGPSGIPSGWTRVNSD